MRVLLTGGGTGGHIYPALAIADRLKAEYPEAELLYIGTKKGLENTIVPQRGIPFATITVEGLPRKLNLAFFKAGLTAIGGGVEALKLVRQFKPDLVIGTGGYVCGPVVMAAKTLHIPAVIHEQNAFPGITNKILARVVDKVMINFASSQKYFVHPEKIAVTGLPVRHEVLEMTKAQGQAYFGLRPDKVTMLVSGGSRGAQSINQAMVDCYPTLVQEKRLQVIHLTGTLGYEETMTKLRKKGLDLAQYPQIMVKPYLHEMEYALAAADFCVGRSGATYLAEVTACGLASILIPYPFASENHQQFNAQALVDQGAAVMLLNQDLQAQSLLEEIDRLVKDDAHRAEMGRKAAEMGNKEALNDIIALLQPYIA